jgi:hypothetical protein
VVPDFFSSSLAQVEWISGHLLKYPVSKPNSVSKLLMRNSSKRPPGKSGVLTIQYIYNFTLYNMYIHILRHLGSEYLKYSIIEDQSLSPSYDLAPSPTPSPVSQVVSQFSVFLCVAGRAY